MISDGMFSRGCVKRLKMADNRFQHGSTLPVGSEICFEIGRRDANTSTDAVEGELSLLYESPDCPIRYVKVLGHSSNLQQVVAGLVLFHLFLRLVAEDDSALARPINSRVTTELAARKR